MSAQIKTYRSGLAHAPIPSDKSKEVLWIPPEMKEYFGNSATDLSPVDFIADLQRRYISMHPFGDGNGRTSHFLQDIVMRALDLPFAPTGSLRDIQ